jgi:hypothetical protein
MAVKPTIRPSPAPINSTSSSGLIPVWCLFRYGQAVVLKRQHVTLDGLADIRDGRLTAFALGDPDGLGIGRCAKGRYRQMV